MLNSAIHANCRVVNGCKTSQYWKIACIYLLVVYIAVFVVQSTSDWIQSYTMCRGAKVKILQITQIHKNNCTLQAGQFTDLLVLIIQLQFATFQMLCMQMITCTKSGEFDFMVFLLGENYEDCISDHPFNNTPGAFGLTRPVAPHQSCKLIFL